MDSSVLQKQFARMGARLKVREGPMPWRVRDSGFSVDVGHDQHGTFFDIIATPELREELEVVDVEARDRHLLLMIRQQVDRKEEKHKFLCGHDERDWFVAAVPETGGVATVRTAKEALKPQEVQAAQARKGLKARHRNRRHNAAFIRQGEWFFIPEPDLVVDRKLVLRNEPLARAGGKPHWAEFLYRSGGETVYVSRDYPQGLTEPEYKALLARKPSAKREHWTVMRRNPGVWVQGKIRHPDHKTVKLNGWHRVLMNTESQAASKRHVVFLD
jgi:hypothetical protein